MATLRKSNLAGQLAVLAGAVFAAGALAWWWWQRPNVAITIAVLPLTNLSPDPANDYFADGLTDEIIRNLCIIDGLAVRSQTSSFVFKGKPRNVREAGQQIQADYILAPPISDPFRCSRVRAKSGSMPRAQYTSNARRPSASGSMDSNAV